MQFGLSAIRAAILTVTDHRTLLIEPCPFWIDLYPKTPMPMPSPIDPYRQGLPTYNRDICFRQGMGFGIRVFGQGLPKTDRVLSVGWWVRIGVRLAAYPKRGKVYVGVCRGRY